MRNWSPESPTVLAAIWWKTLLDLIEPAMADLPSGRGKTVRYDELIAVPEETMAELAEFCELEISPVFMKRIRPVATSGSTTSGGNCRDRSSDSSRLRSAPTLDRWGSRDQESGGP